MINEIKEAQTGQVEIDCFNCDGAGWTVTHRWSGYPEQETCETCNGSKKLMVDADFARMMKEGEPV
jgi:DnaJ-class molecular chaperone